jgi:hypothetical protein
MIYKKRKKMGKKGNIFVICLKNIPLLIVHQQRFIYITIVDISLSTAVLPMNHC